jgi:pyruvate/2-oxoglutarate dehydrogenase complex dihydrolipoamide acyltransferase (E2) component
MPTKVALPEMGEGVTDATITQWLKQEGDQVKQYEALVEVNTDKVDTEIPSPVDGTVLKILYPADTVVAVDQVLAWIGEPGEDIPENGDAPVKSAPPPTPVEEKKADAPKPAAAPPPAPKPKPTPTPAPAPTTGQLSGAVSPLAAKIAADKGVDPTSVQGSGMGGMVTRQDVLANVDSGGANRRTVSAKSALSRELDPMATFISPVVSRLAAEHNIDLNKVQGTGRHGRITKFDMQRLIEEGSAGMTAGIKPLPAFAGMQPGTVIKHTPVRRSIAKHMVESKHTSPHVSAFYEADLSAVWEHRAVHKDRFARQGVKLTFTAFFVQAAAKALQAYPVVNSSWSEEGIILHPEINIGMAVSLDADGLIVPVIRGADQLDLLGTARAVNDLANRARNKQLTPDEVRGGTFTITNHGTSGSLFATPVINQPQCGILGTGMIQKRVVVVDDAIAIKPMVYLSLTFDHRILDGAVADYFLAALKQGLENGPF